MEREGPENQKLPPGELARRVRALQRTPAEHGVRNQQLQAPTERATDWEEVGAALRAAGWGLPPKSPDSNAGPSPPTRRVRRPDLKISGERVALHHRLASELATLEPVVFRHTKPESLKRKYPEFKVWDILRDEEIQEVLNGESFVPRAWATKLVLRKYGLTSPETLKKDRKKLRAAEKRRVAGHPASRT